MNTPDVDTQVRWKTIYTLGGAAALIPVGLGLLDIGLSFLPAGTVPDPTQGNVLEWFALLQANWFLGLRGLGLWNVVIQILTIPLYLALYTALQNTHRVSASLAVLLFCIGAGVYIANNPALAMLDLSHQYAVAAGEAQKSMLAAAGQALLAQAEDFTPGAFLGFIIPEISGFMMAASMLNSQTFGRRAAIPGMLGFTALLIFTIWATFIPVYYEMAMLIAALGGLLSIAWYLLLARRLFQLAQ